MPTSATAIITLDQAKSFLNIDRNDFDAELSDFIGVASQMIVNRVGQVAGSPTVDEWHDGGTDRIVLRNQGPIQSVTAVTESYGSITYTLTEVTLDSGSTAGTYTYTVDKDRGLIVRRVAGIAVPFAEGVRNIHVTYVAGYATTPADIVQATQLLLKHLWETQRGSATRRPGAGGMDPHPPATISLPRRVEEILAPYMVPGIG